MPKLCLYFQVHQPYRVRKDYNFFCIGADHQYEDVETNRAIMRKVADRCYLPANALMLDLIQKNKGKFRLSYSISGTALEQFEQYAPEVITSFQKMVDTGCVELISETYYHSLAFQFSRKEFEEQVKAHRKKLKDLFGVVPTAFRNTELIYNNDLAAHIEEMNLYKVILTEGPDHVLGWRSPNFVYQPKSAYKLKLMMKNYKLADDIAFRFSNRSWAEWPLTPEKFAGWVHTIAGNGEVINLFMDYETFGEHQWAETGIFNFLRDMPEEVMKHKDFGFATVSEAADACQPMAKVDVPYWISWADVERDTTAWLGNPLQDSAVEMAYAMEKSVKKTKDIALLHTWRKLLSSDHFYYMCTKWFSDGDVHRYFNPYSTPYDAYVCYINALTDFKERLKRMGIKN